MAPDLLQLVAEVASDDVGGAACREADEHFHLTLGIGLRRGAVGGRDNQHRSREQEPDHSPPTIASSGLNCRPEVYQNLLTPSTTAPGELWRPASNTPGSPRRCD